MKTRMIYLVLVLLIAAAGYTATFTNTAPITLNDGAANPYPAQIDVSGLSGNIRRVTVSL